MIGNIGKHRKAAQQLEQGPILADDPTLTQSARSVEQCSGRVVPATRRREHLCISKQITALCAGALTMESRSSRQHKDVIMKKLAASLFLSALLFSLGQVSGLADAQFPRPQANSAAWENTPKQVELLQKAAEQGDADAQCHLGLMYANGEGVSLDYSKAMEWYQKASNNGNAFAKYAIGRLYQKGKGVPQDYGMTMDWFKKASDGGCTEAQNAIAMMYLQGNGVPVDYGKAAVWCQKAASAGFPSAEHNLGVMYAHGEGVPQDYSKAAEWYQKAAEQGFADSENNLGSLYFYGRGVPRNLSKAREWYQKAADNGIDEARKNLAVMSGQANSGASSNGQNPPAPSHLPIQEFGPTESPKYFEWKGQNEHYNGALYFGFQLGITLEQFWSIIQQNKMMNNFVPLENMPAGIAAFQYIGPIPSFFNEIRNPIFFFKTTSNGKRLVSIGNKMESHYANILSTGNITAKYGRCTDTNEGTAVWHVGSHPATTVLVKTDGTVLYRHDGLTAQ